MPQIDGKSLPGLNRAATADGTVKKGLRRRRLTPIIFFRPLALILIAAPLSSILPRYTNGLVQPRHRHAVYSGTVRGFVGSPTWMIRYLTGLSELGFRETACNAPGGS